MKLASRSVVLVGAWIVGMLASGACARDGADASAADDTSAPHTDSSTTPSGSVPEPPVPATAAPGISVATGVFTAAQAARGYEVYSATCAQCHTMAQHSGTTFATAWNGRRLADLYEIVRGTMPLDNPGGLTDEEYIDVVAYMMDLNGVAAGKAPLRADAPTFRELRIDLKPATGE